MLKRYPFISRLLLFVVLPATLLALGLYATVADSLAQRDGERQLPALRAPATVAFDGYGVPRVTAATDRDAFFVQGYLHASERMWQMELQRRLVQGRLSEVFGGNMVPSDRWMRTLGLRRAADDTWRATGPEGRAVLQAYAEGVNAWLQTTATLPPEFLAFGLHPDPWKPADSLAIQKLFALELAQNMYAEIDRVSALRMLAPEKLRTFYPHDPDLKGYLPQAPEAPARVATAAGDRFRDFRDAYARLERDWGVGARFSGSNAWAVSGALTRSGAPLLAGDPHLATRHPSVWYAIQLQGKRLQVQGMSLAGIPGILVGRNAKVAWAATSLMADQQDLFALDVPEDDNRNYRTSHGPEPISISEETLRIRPDFPAFLNKDIEPVDIRVRRTRIGPVVSDALASTDATYALRWSALDADDRSFEAFLGLQYAQDWSGFRNALRLLKAPGLTFVYADAAGNIGSQVAGALPRRGYGEGVLPLPAYDPAHGWQQYIPFDALPSRYNPPGGMIASANGRVELPGYPAISHEWAPSIRENRILALLRAHTRRGARLDVQTMSTMQNDVFNAAAARLVRFSASSGMQQAVVATAPEEIRGMVQQAAHEVFAWDGRFSPDSAGATVYHYWLVEMKKRIFGELNPGGWALDRNPLARSLMLSVGEDELMRILRGENDHWCVRRMRDRINCQKELVDGFHAAVVAVRDKTNSQDPSGWRWESVARVRYVHQPLGRIRALEWLLNDEYPMRGSKDTLSVADAQEDEDGRLTQTFGVSSRQIFDLSRPGGYYVLPTGQSGHFLDAHYDDMADGFASGEVMGYCAQASCQAGGRLRLVPSLTQEQSPWRP